MNDPLALCTSRAMQSVREMIAKIAGTDVTVLLRGESGVGKEVVARAIHNTSPRANKLLLKINCAAMPGELLESELFGHQKGAFTEYSWPGNVRELENTLKRIVVLGNAEHVPQEIAASLVGGTTTTVPASGAPAAPAVADTVMGLKDVARRAARDAERLAIKEMLERVHWNRAKAARLLQISYKALLYKIVDCGLANPASETEEELAAAS